MKKLSYIFFLFTAIIAFSQGTDNASNSVYDDGWGTGDNGGTGFGAWTNNSASSGGIEIGSSTGNNSSGDTNGDNDIDVSGESWRLWANSSGFAGATRDFSTAMAANDKFTIYMDIGTAGAVVGFYLRNSSNENIIHYFAHSANSDYKIDDNVDAEKTSAIAYTDEGIKVEISLTSSSTYDIKTTKLVDNSNNTVSGNFSGTISRLSVYNSSNGNGAQYDTYFNSINHEVGVLPVELTSFKAKSVNKSVKLEWQTATEINNYGFEIERKKLEVKSKKWEKIGFVNGHGNSNSPKDYSFTDNLSPDRNINQSFQYRLKQIDFDGAYEYSDEIEVTLENIVTEYSLKQNYPNPFNPTTVISYTIANVGTTHELSLQDVSLIIYDILGNEIAMLVNERQSAGSYSYNYNGKGLPSGVYIYKLKTNNFVETKKMLLVK